jgi:hypothetical protein
LAFSQRAIERVDCFGFGRSLIGLRIRLDCEGLDARIIDLIQALGTVTICGLSKLPLKLCSESHLFPASTIAPDDFSGPRPSMALGGVIPNADGHV